MAITFSCGCGSKLQVADEFAGKLMRCPHCKTSFRSPQPTAITVEPEPILVQPTSEQPPPIEKVAYEEVEQEEIETQYYGPPRGKPDFFRDAPKEIGQIHAAYTSLAKYVAPKSFATLFTMASVISGAIIFVLLIATIILQIVARHPLPWLALLLGFPVLSLLIILLVFGITFGSSGFSHYCAYVGTKGCAMFRCSGSRDKIVKKDVLIFDEAAHLRVQTTHVFVNGAYPNTNYNYVWTNRYGKEILAIADSHNSHNNPPPAGSSYHFAQAAEMAWSLFLLATILPELKAGGKYQFRLTGDNSITLRQDSLQLILNGKKQVFLPEHIAEMRIAAGVIVLKEPGSRAGWFTETGIHRFAFADLANARVFLLLMRSEEHTSELQSR